MEVLLIDGETLSLTGPEVAHAGDHIKWVPHAQYDFVRFEWHFFTQRIVSLDEPALVVDKALAWEATVLETIVQGIIQIAIWTSKDAADLL